MSNIPASAMPHAWVHEDEQDYGEEVQAPSLRSLAIAGGIGALLLYLILRK